VRFEGLVEQGHERRASIASATIASAFSTVASIGGLDSAGAALRQPATAVKRSATFGQLTVFHQASM
jgi:hypothetical protein